MWIAFIIIAIFVIFLIISTNRNENLNQISNIDTPIQDNKELEEFNKLDKELETNNYVGDVIFKNIQELQSLNSKFETVKEPTILENIKSNMEALIKSCIALEGIYPDAICKLKDAQEKLQRIKERYNERLYLNVQESLDDYKLKMSKPISDSEKDLETGSIFEQIQYTQGFIEKTAKNSQEYIKSFTKFRNEVEDLYSNLPYKNLELSEAFNIILGKTTFKDYITAIATLICNNELTKENLDKILNEYHINNIMDIKLDLLDLLLSYINIVINTFTITEKEMRNIKILKLYFRINEGDFYKYKRYEIKSIYQTIFSLYYRNNVGYSYELFMAGIQDVFDLSYSQLDKLKQIN
jgi:hypothetical protein